MDQLTKMMGNMMGQLKKEGNQPPDEAKIKELEETF